MIIRLFGAFRNLQSEPELALDVPANVKTVGDLRKTLTAHFAGSAANFDAAGLLAKSAIANDREVLSDESTFAQGDRLALLPPVSGG